MNHITINEKALNFAEYKSKNNIYIMNIRKQTCSCHWYSIKSDKIKQGLVKTCHHITELNELLSFKNIRGVYTE